MRHLNIMKNLIHVLIFMIACCVSFYASAKHSCEIKDGRVVCVGDNEYGQCNVPSLRKVTRVFVDRNMSCAEDVSVTGVKRKVCWGEMLDYDTYIDIEILFPERDKFSNIIGVTGHYRQEYYCGFYNSSLECWGYEALKLLNNVPQLKNPRQLAMVNRTICALDDDGVKCWGKNKDIITKVPSIKNPKQVFMNWNYAYVINDNGVTFWGDEKYIGWRINIHSLKHPIRVVDGRNNICFMDDDGLKCWDKNGQFEIPLLRKISDIQLEPSPTFYGYSGDEWVCAKDESSWGVKRRVCFDSTKRNGRVDILQPKIDQFANVSSESYLHRCGFYNGILECWGSSSYGQANVPSLKNPRQVAVGAWHTCALDADGVKCWGSNSDGQTNVPPLRKVLKISANGDTSCAIDESSAGLKREICWGDSKTIDIVSPSMDKFSNISKGQHIQCGFYKKLIECWGDGKHVQFFNIPTVKNLKLLAVGGEHACALDDEGVKCWGDNVLKQTDVPPLENPRQVVVGYNHTCALDNNGVKCWGSNSDGQTNVPFLNNPREIIAGAYYTCASDKDVVGCWGKDAKLFDLNNTYSDLLVIGSQNGFAKISNTDNAGVNDLSRVASMFIPYIFKNELRFFYSFDKTFGEKLFKILPPGSKYSNLMVLLHTELKKEMGLVDTEEKYRFLWNKEIYLPYGHEFLKEPSAPENDEERKQLLNVLVESIKTTMPLMSGEYKQRASALILKLSTSVDAESLSEAAEFVSDAGINPYIRPRVKLQMELIRLLGL